MGLITPTMPTPGEPNSSADFDILNALNAIVAEINGQLDSANIKDGSLLDTDLASPNNGVWRTIMSVRSHVPAGTAVGTDALVPGSPVAAPASGMEKCRCGRPTPPSSRSRARRPAPGSSRR